MSLSFFPALEPCLPQTGTVFMSKGMARVRHAAPSRRTRPAPARRRASARCQPPRRRDHGLRRPYPRGHRRFPLHFGKSLTKVVIAGFLMTTLAVTTAFFADGAPIFRGAKHTPVAAISPAQVADQIVYTARTANDAAVTLPGAVQDDLVKAGRAHQSVELTKVGYKGEVSSSYIDMPPAPATRVRTPSSRSPAVPFWPSRRRSQPFKRQSTPRLPLLAAAPCTLALPGLISAVPPSSSSVPGLISPTLTTSVP